MKCRGGFLIRPFRFLKIVIKRHKGFTVDLGIDYDKFNDIIIIYLTKEDIFKKGSTVYYVDMNIVSDQKETVKAWDCGLKVMYINTEGLTDKNINKYLIVLTDNITYLKEYKNTNRVKRELFETGGRKVSAKWLLKLMKEYERDGIKKGIEKGLAKGAMDFAKKMIEKGLLTKEQTDELSSEFMVAN